MKLSLSPVPDVDESTWQFAWHEEQCVDPDYIAVSGEARCKPLGGDRDTAEAILVESPGGRILGAALLYLDEGEGFAAPDDQIDLAARNTGAHGEDSPALQPQPPGGERLRPPPARFGLLAVQSLPPSSSARA